ncbi:unnamed protein product, partial [Brassica rapa subsp. narinosa]
RRTRLDLTVSASKQHRNRITTPSFRWSSDLSSLRRNHHCSSNSIYPSESTIALRELIRQGQRFKRFKNSHLPERKADGDGSVEVSISRNQNPYYERLHHAITPNNRVFTPSTETPKVVVDQSFDKADAGEDGEETKTGQVTLKDEGLRHRHARTR